jgi:hypothetical protein
MTKIQLDERLSGFRRDLMNAIQHSNLAPKIHKAINMLRREKNLLYIEKSEGNLRAVVKSQTNPKKLEYACSIKANGSFFCGTQNLYPCGGLRGTICKHIILTLIATVKQGYMKNDEIIDWVKKTINYRPKLDKSEASSIFKHYQSALNAKPNGTQKLEWRPVEILPEDFMAL